MEILFRLLFFDCLLLDVCLESCFGSETSEMDWYVVLEWGSSHSDTYKVYLSEKNPCYRVALLG